MDIVQSDIDFVNGQLVRTKSIYNKNPFNGSKLPEVIKGFEELLGKLEFLKNSPVSTVKSSAPTFRQEQLYLLPKDLDDLPAELLAQLNHTKSDKLELNILKSIEDAGGLISIDVLLVRLYKLTGQINDRRQLSAKLFRMSKKGLIHSVPKKKSVYSLTPIDPSLLTDDDDEFGENEDD